MTLTRLCFLFGFLELGFILRGVELLSPEGFLLWSGAGCLALMFPQVSEWASRRPKTAGTKGNP